MLDSIQTEQSSMNEKLRILTYLLMLYTLPVPTSVEHRAYYQERPISNIVLHRLPFQYL